MTLSLFNDYHPSANLGLDWEAGPDVSDFQLTSASDGKRFWSWLVDVWAQHSGSRPRKPDWAIIKVTEGRSLVHDWYPQHVLGANYYGVTTLHPYHFFLPSVPVLAQVNNFMSIWNRHDADWGYPVIDVEAAGSGDISLLCYEWCDRVEQVTQKPSRFYTARWFSEQYLRNAILSKFALWVAHYASRGVDIPLMPSVWQTFLAWQWQSFTAVFGHLDLNVAAPGMFGKAVSFNPPGDEEMKPPYQSCLVKADNRGWILFGPFKMHIKDNESLVALRAMGYINPEYDTTVEDYAGLGTLVTIDEYGDYSLFRDTGGGMTPIGYMSDTLGLVKQLQGGMAVDPHVLAGALVEELLKRFDITAPAPAVSVGNLSMGPLPATDDGPAPELAHLSTVDIMAELHLRSGNPLAPARAVAYIEHAGRLTMSGFPTDVLTEEMLQRTLHNR